jgi:hypothetical protein
MLLFGFRNLVLIFFIHWQDLILMVDCIYFRREVCCV